MLSSKYLNKSLYLLRDSKKKLFKIILFFLVVAVLDVLGLSLIGSYISLLTTQSPLDENIGIIFNWFSVSLELDRLLIGLGIVLLVIFALKTATTIWINFVIVNFSMDQQTQLRSFLMSSYQVMPYTDFLNRNSSEYVYSIQTLTQQFSQGVLLTGIRMLSDIIIGSVILVFLAWTNFQAFILLLSLILLLIVFYDKFLKHKVYIYGVKANLSAEQMLQSVNEGIRGLKEIRILGKKGYFHQKVYT